jgi:hypothetical protein
MELPVGMAEELVEVVQPLTVLHTDERFVRRADRPVLAFPAEDGSLA